MFKETWQNFKAWRRGERRIAPSGTRGRVYASAESPLAGAHKVETKTTYMTLAKVIRADGRPDEHYNLTEDMKLSPDDFDNLRGGTTHG